MRGFFLALVGLTACSGAPAPILDEVELPDAAQEDVLGRDVAVHDAADSSADLEASADAGAHDASPRDSAPPSDAGPETGSAIGWPSPCETCVYEPAHDCIGVGSPPGGSVWVAFHCGPACLNPPPTKTAGPSNCSYETLPSDDAGYEMCCPSTNPGF